MRPLKKTKKKQKLNKNKKEKEEGFSQLFFFTKLLQDNNSYSLSNLILNEIQTSKKRMSLIETLFLTCKETLALKIQILVYAQRGGG
jgi:hypothetical protein